jgi:hypothetical protein
LCAGNLLSALCIELDWAWLSLTLVAAPGLHRFGPHIISATCKS